MSKFYRSPYKARPAWLFHGFGKRLCAVCGHEVRPGRRGEHRDCQRELERREAAGGASR